MTTLREAAQQALSVGDIVQICPDKEIFGGCMVTVTEVREWGVQGYIQSAGVSGQQFVRPTWDEIEPTGGKAVWIIE